MKRCSMTSDEEIHSTQPAAKKPRVEQPMKEQMIDAGLEGFLHKIEEELGKKKKQEFEMMILASKWKEISDVAVVKNAKRILAGNSNLLLSFDVFVPNKLKEIIPHSKKLRTKKKVTWNLEKVETDEEIILTSSEQPRDLALQESITDPASQSTTVGFDGSGSRTQEIRGYCRVLNISFPQSSRYSRRHVSITSELHPSDCKTRRRRTSERPKDVHKALTIAELEQIDRIQENLILMFSRLRSQQAK